MLTQIEAAPQAVVAVLEGAVMGGGFGLCCVSDVAHRPRRREVSPARDRPRRAPGPRSPPSSSAASASPRLAASRSPAAASTPPRPQTLGLVHHLASGTGSDSLDGQLDRVLADIARCAPEAVATTKRLVLAAAAAHGEALEALLDDAAEDFARAARGPESLEGMTAFIQKRRPKWADE
jgi:isohexenylglutaconyl-CoA hydratase